MICSGSDDHTVRLWDIAQKTTVHTFIDHTEDVNAVRFHPDGTCVASGSDDKKIKLWDIRSKRLIQHYDAHIGPVSSIAFHPNGNYLLSAGHDGLVKIWDLKLGQILYTLHGHEGPVIASNFSNCGDFFCTGGTDSIVMVWQSNVSCMDDEFNYLKKSEISYMKSNRSKFEDFQHKENIEKFKVSGNTSKKSNSKYKVQAENSENLAGSQISNQQKDSRKLTQSDLNKETPGGNAFGKLPSELASTFEKMISQMDLIAK